MASPFCSQLARSHGVSPAGTATEAAHWLLIEDASPWGSHAVEDAEWHGEVREAIETWTEEVPDLRVQLIRRELTTWDTPGRVRCIAVRAGPQPVVHNWSLNAYEDLAAVPVPEVLHASSADVDPAPFVLTCVNGRRDACCAKWGRPVATAAADVDSNIAWQTSHLGGHRFAPTALVLPHGTHYGWLCPDDMAELIAAHRQGHLYDLDRVRGAVHQPRPVQAACIALRRRLGRRDLHGIRGTLVEEGEDQWTVHVQRNGQTGVAHVRQVQQEPPFPHSCGSDETKPDAAWRVTWDSAAL